MHLRRFPNHVKRKTYSLKRKVGEKDGDEAKRRALLKAVESSIAHILRTSGQLGHRRYAAGQMLSVLHEGVWRDAEVNGGRGMVQM